MKNSAINLIKSDIAFSIIVSFLFKSFGAVSLFIFTALLTNYLGANKSGSFFLAFALINFFSVFSRVGLDQTIIRFTSIANSQDGQFQIIDILSKAVLVTAIMSGVCCFLIYFYSDYIAGNVFNNSSLSTILKNMAPAVIGLSIITIVSMSFQGLNRLKSSVFIINIALNLILIIILLNFKGLNEEDFAKLYGFTSLMVALISLVYWVFILPSRKRLYKNKIDWGIVFSSCMPLWVKMLMAQTIQWSGQLIAGAWVEPVDIAQLAVAQRTTMVTSFILVAVILVVAPRFAILYKKGDITGLKKIANLSVKLSTLFSLPIFIFMLLMPEFFMGIFGRDFVSGGLLLQILVIGQFFTVVTGSVGYLLTMTGNEREMRNTMLISAPFALIVSLILVPFYGVIGSAIATSLALSLQNLLAVWYVNRKLGFNTLTIWRSQK